MMQFYIDLLYSYIVSLYIELKPIVINFFTCQTAEQVEEDNYKQLIQACQQDNVEMLKSYPISNINELLFEAVSHKATNCVDYILELNPTNLNECLIIASQTYCYNIVDKLLNKGADPNKAIAIKTSANITNLLMRKRSNILQ